MSPDGFGLFMASISRHASCGTADVDNYRVADAMKKKAEPVKDEWGIYDPSQAGFAAVIRKLLEAEETAASPSSDSVPRTGKT